MNIIVAVLKDISSYFNPRTKKGFVRLSILVVIIFIGNGILQKEDTPDEVSFPQLRHVEVASVLTLTGSLKLSLIGSVESLAQADIQTETSGRVTSVNVELGQDVIAGTVVAQLENASQFAALLQAEGVYEAAVAAAAQSDIGTTEASIALDVAKNSALTTYRNAFTTFRSILQSDVDQLFSEPKASLPGVRVRAGTDVTYLNTERVAFEALLNNWQIATDNATA
ncbi:MAG: multidrug efflux pump subunit AcrA (membrane-fusion protein), partial [Candidatus Azotimanducaceae bacterium]